MTEPGESEARAHSPAAPAAPSGTVGFQMSGRRAAVEIVAVITVLVGLVALALFGARHLASRYAKDIPVDADRTFGEQAAKMLAATTSMCDAPEAKTYVEAIASPLVTALADPRFSFTFVVADDPEVNAFALPGGFVTVDRGLLESAETGDEVAAVLAHELSHVTHRHSTERMLRELGATAILSAVFGGTDVAVPAKAVHDLVSTAYDRDQERDADQNGLVVLAKANVDPSGMARFFERLEKSSLTPPALISTHPDPGDRAKDAKMAVIAGRTYRSLPPPPKPFPCKKP